MIYEVYFDMIKEVSLKNDAEERMAELLYQKAREFIIANK